VAPVDVVLVRAEVDVAPVRGERCVGDLELARREKVGLAHNAHQVVIEGDSYRTRQRPGATPLPTLKRRKTP
jgi:hypothetical protein